MKRVFITIIAVMFLLCITLTSFAGRPEPPPTSTSFIPPAWSQKLPAAERFVLVLDGEAVLDKETGLVWEKSPDIAPFENWHAAKHSCITKTVGLRKGWRLPTAEELSSLIDPLMSTPALPSGHPFTNVQWEPYWSSTTHSLYTTSVWLISISYGGGWTYADKGLTSPYKYVWCVRGGHGYDAY